MKKRFGQHFLTNRSILDRIIQFAKIERHDTVVEIGPGRGALTLALASTVQHVIAIEIDRDLIANLRAKMPSNVQVIEGDALEIVFPPGPFEIVSNLPYNIATPLFKRFIEHRNRISGVTVMIQREVAERLTAKPGTKAYGPLTVLIRYYADVIYGFTVAPGAFTPPPKVDSAVIRLQWKPNVQDAADFTDFVHRAFSSRRKKLINNLLAMSGAAGREETVRRLEQVGIPTNARPEDLSIEEFMRVYNQLR